MALSRDCHPGPVALGVLGRVEFDFHAGIVFTKSSTSIPRQQGTPFLFLDPRILPLHPLQTPQAQARRGFRL